MVSQITFRIFGKEETIQYNPERAEFLEEILPNSELDFYGEPKMLHDLVRQGDVKFKSIFQNREHYVHLGYVFDPNEVFEIDYWTREELEKLQHQRTPCIANEHGEDLPVNEYLILSDALKERGYALWNHTLEEAYALVHQEVLDEKRRLQTEQRDERIKRLIGD